MKEDILKIENIEGFDNGSVSYCRERGSVITSLKLKGKEIIYLDKETFNDSSKNVRGGIPILFPNAGPISRDSIFPNLNQHGFARNQKWENEKVEEGFKSVLFSNEETKKVYPFDFKLSLFGNFEKDGSFTLEQEVENREEYVELPISMGLHPYFSVADNEKGNIKFNFEGGKEIEDQIESWANGKYISIDNPKIKDPNAVMEVFIPSLGTLKIDVSVEYQKIWIWSISGGDFICIEPVMRDIDGLINNPEKIEPRGKFSARVNFKLI
jgi:galactose mutarotase-like enzyme